MNLLPCWPGAANPKRLKVYVMHFKLQPGGALNGEARVPGDKSISHRSVIFGALAEGTTRVTGLLEGADILSTIGAMRALGATVTKEGEAWTVIGCGASGLKTPVGVIDCGNAGTGVRLIMGAAAGYNITATYTGDVSLRSQVDIDSGIVHLAGGNQVLCIVG